MNKQTYGSIKSNNESQDLLGGLSIPDDEERPTEPFPIRKMIAAGVLASVLVVLIPFGIFLTLFQQGDDNANQLEQLQQPSSDPEFWYTQQTLDHFDTSDGGNDTWAQRYYQEGSYFAGPGHPIFVIIGGEDELEGILYPFVRHHLARQMAAYTFCLEHRFYGTSQPVANATHGQLHRLLSPAQALEDLIQFIQFQREQLGCHADPTNPLYCPVVTVGGSYPGFLSALLRLTYPDVVDIGYASSAPLHLYRHDGDPNAYFDYITLVADRASPGCAGAVKQTLMAVTDSLLSEENTDTSEAAQQLGICGGGQLPAYITNTTILQQEIMIVVATHFAESNMDYYPPGPDQAFVQNCRIFQDGVDQQELPNEIFSKFLTFQQQNSDDDSASCFDLHTELPPGEHGTISASDWSGIGDGDSGYYWDYLSCILLPQCGFSEQSMFPRRPWTLEWQTQHCRARFGVTPDMDGLRNRFHFLDKLTQNASKILFTNGINDGWSALSVEQNVSDTVRVLNFVNGAHHSDLQHVEPSDRDTPDIQQGYIAISTLLHEWLNLDF